MGVSVGLPVDRIWKGRSNLQASVEIYHWGYPRLWLILSSQNDPLKVLPCVVEGAGGLGAGKTSGTGTRGVSLDVVIGGRTGYSNTNGGESSDNRSKVHADCYPAENPSL